MVVAVVVVVVGSGRAGDGESSAVGKRQAHQQRPNLTTVDPDGRTATWVDCTPEMANASPPVMPTISALVDVVLLDRVHCRTQG